MFAIKFDKRIEEMSRVGSIKYGNGKSKLCAEFYCDSKGEPLIFLWLPRKGLTSKIIARARIWTDWNGNALVEGYILSGIGTKITSYKKVIANRHRKAQEILAKNVTYVVDMKYLRQYAKDVNAIKKKLSNLQPITYEKMQYFDEGWRPATDEELQSLEEEGIEFEYQTPYESLEFLVNIALEKWLERL